MNLLPPPPTGDGQVPRLYFTARGVSASVGKVGAGIEDDVLGGGVVVEQGGGIVTDGPEGGNGNGFARRPVLMSRAMRDFAGLDQVTNGKTVSSTQDPHGVMLMMSD